MHVRCSGGCWENALLCRLKVSCHYSQLPGGKRHEHPHTTDGCICMEDACFFPNFLRQLTVEGAHFLGICIQKPCHLLLKSEHELVGVTLSILLSHWLTNCKFTSFNIFLKHSITIITVGVHGDFLYEECQQYILHTWFCSNKSVTKSCSHEDKFFCDRVVSQL